MQILSLLLNFIGSLLAKVISDALKTPANTTEISRAEGDLPPLPAEVYTDSYGVSDPRD